jgi:ABC-type antimicrobial peptide transport system permease subunit
MAQRSRELAVRLAVGASVENILWLVLKEGLQMGVMGASMGLVGIWATQKPINGVLFGISPVDPPTFAGSAAFLVAVVMVACWAPAWHTARVAPRARVVMRRLAHVRDRPARSRLETEGSPF